MWKLIIAVFLCAGWAACSADSHPGLPDAAAGPRCTNAATLEIPGPCAGGTCLSTCPFGCADGACQPEACQSTCSITDVACKPDSCGGLCGACGTGVGTAGLSYVLLGESQRITVAPDAAHLASLRRVDPPCLLGGDQGSRLDVWTLDPDPELPKNRHVTIGSHVLTGSLAFTSAGDLVYVETPDSCNASGELWTAHADGSQPHRLTGDVAASPPVQLAGQTLVYRSASDQELYALALPDGAPVKLTGLAPPFFNPQLDPPLVDYQLSPDGGAVWARSSMPNGRSDLRVSRSDASAAATLVSAYNTLVKPPLWAPDGKHLAYATVGTSSMQGAVNSPVIAVDADGTNPVALGEHSASQADPTGVSAFAAFSGDGRRIAFLDADAATAGDLDLVVHSFDAGPDVRIRDIGLGGLDGPIATVGAIGFSNDGSRLFASIATDANNGAVVTARSDADGAAQQLADIPGAWTESPDGKVVVVGGAVRGVAASSATEVVTLGGTTQIITGTPQEPPQFSPALASPSVLIQGGGSLGVYSNAGGSGNSLFDFTWTPALSDAVHAGAAPFVFGWAGLNALYPAAVNDADPAHVRFVLMDVGRGVVLPEVVHYAVRSNPLRVFVVDSANLLWVVQLAE